MAAAIKGSPYVIQLLGQWKAYPSLFSFDYRDIYNGTIQVDKYTPILPAPEEVEPGTSQSTKPISILLLAVLNGAKNPIPPRLLQHLWVRRQEPPHIT
jgi:hypothetical protein